MKEKEIKMARLVVPPSIRVIEYKVVLESGTNQWTQTFYSSVISDADIEAFTNAVVQLVRAIYRIIVVIRKVFRTSGIYNVFSKTWVADGLYSDSKTIDATGNVVAPGEHLPLRNVLNVTFDAQMGTASTQQYNYIITEDQMDNGRYTDAQMNAYGGFFGTFVANTGGNLVNRRGQPITEITVNRVPGTNRKKRYSA